jgi:tRNA A-37 threonylcarbamoyl transferase component Bud32
MSQVCQYCGKPVLPNAVGGLCPECLMKAALASNSGTNLGRFTPPPLEEIQKHFAQLEIIELLGHGGMGAVYKARQPALNRNIALKILPAEHTVANPGFAERFQREARALARLNHPNIVAVYEFGQTGGFHFFIMEYVEGVTLRELVRGQKVAPVQALQIIPQICEALQFAHDAGVVHRDIKPENILIDTTGRVKIADFGLAKILAGNVPEVAITKVGHSMGTPHYMAPEQVEKPGQVDHRADIYSLGVVFYELLTGELPLGRFSPPSGRAQIDFRLDEIVLRALEKEPARRYQKASHVKDEVQTVANHPQQLQRPRSALVSVVAAVFIAIGVLVLAGIASYVLYQLRQQKKAANNPATQAAIPTATPTITPLDTNISIMPGGGQPTELLGGPRQVDLVVSPQLKQDIVTKILGMNRGTWRQALATAEQVAALPPDEGFNLVQLHWRTITNAESRKQFLKAFTFQRHPRLLAVLEMGLLDNSPDVQSWVLDYLKAVTGRNYSEDYSAGTQYLASRRNMPLEAALNETARNIARDLNTSDEQATVTQLKALQAANLLRDQTQAVVDSGLGPALEQIITERSRGLVEMALQATSGLALSPEWYQRVALPRLTSNNPVSIRMAAARALDRTSGEWAVPALTAALKDLPRIPESERNNFAFSLGSALAKTRSSKAIPEIIAAIQADNNYSTIYGLGYFALTPLTGVPYNESHNGAWWANWWETNKTRFGQ